MKNQQITLLIVLIFTAILGYDPMAAEAKDKAIVLISNPIPLAVTTNLQLVRCVTRNVSGNEFEVEVRIFGPELGPPLIGIICHAPGPTCGANVDLTFPNVTSGHCEVEYFGQPGDVIASFCKDDDRAMFCVPLQQKE